jgi:hypothetical protein
VTKKIRLAGDPFPAPSKVEQLSKRLSREAAQQAGQLKKPDRATG